MARKKLPFYAMYPSDFDGDEKARMMSDAQVGFFVRCLNHAWMNDGVPANADDLESVIPGRRTHEEFVGIWSVVKSAFAPSNDPARLVNARQAVEKYEAIERSRKAASSIKRRWSKDTKVLRDGIRTYKQNGYEGISATSVGSNTIDNHIHNHIVEPSLVGIRVDEFFELRYRLHPKKKFRSLAESAIAAIPGIETSQVQSAFAAGHDAWLACEDWSWRGGVKAPEFAQFISDQTWKYAPSGEKDPMAEALRMVEES